MIDANMIKHAGKVRKAVKPGDLITHTRCMGCIEEHIFQGFDGQWMMGKATATTKKFGGMDAEDIFPGNVTHINRVPIESLEFLHSRSIP